MNDVFLDGPPILVPEPSELSGKLNEFPPHRAGLRRVRAVPYLYKERWAEAPFGDRWRAIKSRARRPLPAAAAAPGGGGL